MHLRGWKCGAIIYLEFKNLIKYSLVGLSEENNMFLRFCRSFIAVSVAAAFLSACNQSLPSPFDTKSAEHSPMMQPAEMSIAMSGPVKAAVEMPGPRENIERYGKIDTNPVYVVVQTPVSTFSIDVDTGSYS